MQESCTYGSGAAMLIAEELEVDLKQAKLTRSCR